VTETGLTTDRPTLTHSVGSLTTPRTRARITDDRLPQPDDGHLLGLYESDEHLVDSVVSFLLGGLRVGEPAMIVATRAHIAQIEDALEAQGLDVAAARRDRMLVTADAAEVLAGILVDDEPVGARLRAAYDRLRGRCAPTGRPRIFAEMVVLLWEAGLVEAAIELEDLWNDLAEEDGTGFTLFCAYPVAVFEGEEDGLRAVCGQHTALIPSERYAQLPDPQLRLRPLATLHQDPDERGRERLELLRKQRELEDALERLRELDRLRNEFIAMVVHDIRGPVTVTNGLLRVLREELGHLDPLDADLVLSEAIENAERIERLTGDILTVARLESGEFTFDLAPTDLGALVVRAAGQIQRATGREIRVSLAPDLADAYADADRQAQILGNLLGNAVKFSASSEPVSVHVIRRDDRLAVSVRDNGDGIPFELSEQLFRPFARVGDRRVGGTGLGLYTTKALVEGQGGTIWVDSAPGAGSTFTYTVPVARPS
jgi:signal transduction histidine kinase